MASKLQRTKYEKLFERYDHDGDGEIEQADIDAIIAQWTHDFHIVPGSEQWRRMTGAANHMWQDLPGHTDRKGRKRVSKAEWVAAHEKPDFIEAIALPFTLAVFEAGDVDGDGMITLQEYLKAQVATRVPQDEALEVFQAFDEDGDGKISKEEFARHIEAFYKSDDVKAPGSHMAGKV